MADVSGALQMYARATNYIAAAGLDHEVAWQRDSDPASISESIFLREAAWVVLCSGFRESVIRRVFDHISLCFCNWDSASAIVASYPACHLAAQASFRGTAKLSAIVDIARRVDNIRFDVLKSALMSDPINSLRQFPYIGPITVWHLANNSDSMFQNLIDIWYVSLSDWGSAGRGNYVQLSLTPVGRRSK